VPNEASPPSLWLDCRPRVCEGKPIGNRHLRTKERPPFPERLAAGRHRTRSIWLTYNWTSGHAKEMMLGTNEMFAHCAIPMPPLPGRGRLGPLGRGAGGGGELHVRPRPGGPRCPAGAGNPRGAAAAPRPGAGV